MTQEEKKDEFKKLVQPVMDYLRSQHNQHMAVVITAHNAELLEAKLSHIDYD